MVKMKKKIIYILLLLIYLINSFSGIVSAVQINNAQILDLGECERHLQFWDTKQNAWSDIITTYVGFPLSPTHYDFHIITLLSLL